jgi:transcriptional regulator with XRE-family HTH domain
VIYIRKVLRLKNWKKKDLAAAMGMRASRISQLLSTAGPRAYEPIPLALLYEIAHVTEIPFHVRKTTLPPPPTSNKEFPSHN